MKNSEIRALSLEELKDKITTSETALQSLKFGNTISPIENPMQIKDVRRHLARLKTELHTKTLASIKENIASGELNHLNAKEFLSKNSFGSEVNLAKLKKVIDNAAK
ncbi:MAG: 50S ribosomal protein L29 [Bacteroidota bacterium]